MKALLFSAAALLAGCTVNGKPFSLGGSSPGGGMTASGGEASGGASDGAGDASAGGGDAPPTGGDATYAVAAPGSTCRAETSRRAEGQPPFLDRPADPWLAVRDGKPVAMNQSTKTIHPRYQGGPPCDAQHDHCLRDCAWLGRDGRTTQYLFNGGVDWFSAGMELTEGNDTIEMYRTVPASRSNLKVGALAYGRIEGQRIPTSEDDAQRGWTSGKVESIDLAAGTMRLVGQKDPFFLSSARVAVLVYRAGQQVAVIPGADPKAPPSDQLFLPAEKQAGSEDPWKQVDGNGQPRASTELGPVVTFNQDCSAKFNHCLRPSAWMLETTFHLRVVHWNGKAWVDPANGGPLDDPGKAYRTRPAQRGEAKVGTFVIAFRDLKDPPVSEAAAYGEGKWFAGKIASIDGDRVTLDGVDGTIHIDNLRVPLVWWFPGEKAEKVE